MNNIEGINSITLGVTDWEESQKFLSDIGLVSNNGKEWMLLNNSKIIIEKNSENCLIAIEWGLKEAVEPFEVVDPSGIKLHFTQSTKKPIQLKAVETNGWNSINRVDQAVPLYEKIDTIEICHIALSTDNLSASEKFYTDLGFVISDRLIGRGTFLRCSEYGGHHDLFLIESGRKNLHHVAISVRDIYQVFAGGMLMEQKGWTTEIGPGRHPISSSFLWYFKSPLGTMFEYTANEDFLTEEWIPRDIEYSLGITTEWAVEGGMDPITKRQRK